jgi:hypothetical protein
MRTQGLGSWNLAKLDIEQRKELPEDAWNNVKTVSLKFNSLEGIIIIQAIDRSANILTTANRSL